MPNSSSGSVAHRDDPLRVGVVGVWTEAKVSFLLYDLKTRLGIDELATCSALTKRLARLCTSTPWPSSRRSSACLLRLPG